MSFETDELTEIPKCAKLFEGEIEQAAAQKDKKCPPSSQN